MPAQEENRVSTASIDGIRLEAGEQGDQRQGKSGLNLTHEAQRGYSDALPTNRGEPGFISAGRIFATAALLLPDKAATSSRAEQRRPEG